MKILLINCIHERIPFDHDKGSEAYFNCALKTLRKQFPGAEFISAILFPNVMSSEFKISIEAISSPSQRVFALWGFLATTIDILLAFFCSFFAKIIGYKFLLTIKNPLIRWRKKLGLYAGADMIVHLGLDHYSDNGGLITVVEHSKEILLASIMNKPVVLFAQSPGPFRGFTASLLARKAMNSADLVILREEVSLEHLRKAKVDANIKITADPAFLLPPASHQRVKDIFNMEGLEPQNAKKNTTNIGLVLSGYNILSLNTGKAWSHTIIEKLYSVLLFLVPEFLLDFFLRISKRLFHSSGFSASTMYSKDIIELIDFLISETDSNILLMPHSKGGNMFDEVAILTSYMKYFSQPEKIGRIKVLKGDYDARELKGIIGKCDMVISTKMHACIAALSQGIPTVALAWSHKYYGIMKMLGQESYVCSTMSAQDVIPIVKSVWENRLGIRVELIRKIPELKIKAQLTGDLIAKLFKERDNRELL